MSLIYTIQVLNDIRAEPIPAASRNDHPADASSDEVPRSMAVALSTNLHGKHVSTGLSIGDPFRLRLQALDSQHITQVQEEREMHELKERERHKRDVQFFDKVSAVTMTTQY